MAAPPTAPLPAVPASRPATPIVAYAVIPLSGLLGLVVVAWVHDKLGAPLGPTWGAELWSLVKSGAFYIALPYAGVVYGVQRHNARVEALYAAHRLHALTTAAAADHDEIRATTSLTDGRHLSTGSYAALQPGASTAGAVVVLDRTRRRGGESGSDAGERDGED